MMIVIINYSRSQWTRGPRPSSAGACLLILWVRIPPGSWMFVCCEYCVLSLRWADPSSRGVLPTLVRHCVWSRNLVNEEDMVHWGLLCQKKWISAACVGSWRSNVSEGGLKEQNIYWNSELQITRTQSWGQWYIKVGQTQLDYELLLYMTTRFGLSWFGHHQVVDTFVEETVQFVQYRM